VSIQKGVKIIRITGALINVAAILVGGGLGLLLKGKLSDQFSKSILRAIGLCICIIGISGALRGDIMLLIVSMSLGTFLGELFRIENGLNHFGVRLQSKLSKEGESTFSEGFVTATLLFCVGAMAVVGSIDSGLRDDQNIIITKSIIDAVSAMILASSLGVGVLFSAFAVIIYQGSLELFAGFLYNIFTLSLTVQISAVGGVMILGIGANMVVNAKLRVANFLPGFLVAIGYYYLFLR